MADRQNLQPASIIAKLYGSDVRRIQQLNKEGVIKGHGRPAMYDLLPTVMALFEYQRNIIQGKEKDRTVVNLEEEKLRAEVDMKQAKAEAAQLELKELRGNYTEQRMWRQSSPTMSYTCVPCLSVKFWK